MHRRSTQEGAANGGVAARRAVLRWGWRLFRREWRQQLLVLLLLTIAMAAAIFSVTAAYNIVPSSDARFGTANHRLDFDGSDPHTLDTEVSAVRAWFGTVEVIGHQPVPVPGSVETLELRTQDPHGPYGAPMLRLKEGRYPAATGEAAVTDAVAATFQVGVGGTLALDGSARTVVGLVENPGDLDDEFAAAISLALGIAVAAVIAAAAAEHTAGEGNLSDRQLLFRIGDAEPLIPERTPAELARLRTAVDRLAATLDHPAVVALVAAVNPADHEGRGGQVLRPAVMLGRPVGENTLRDIGVLYVATPELLGHLGLDLAPAGPDTDVLTPHTGELRFANLANHSEAAPDGGKEAAPSVTTIDLPAYTSAPASLLTPEGLRRGGWQPAPAGWLVEARTPPTSAQLAQARQVAADTGMTIETRDNQTELTAIRTGATAAGMLLALGILAMTVGLIRSEAAGDLRTLTATGATSTTRRALTAATSGALALLGVLLGATGAYLALLAGYHDDLGTLSRVPLLHLTVTVVGLPLTAAAVGWLLAGREPPALARQPLA
jgi:hypothetical protein